MTTMATQTQTTDKQAIEQLYKQQYRAMIEKDTAALRPMFADDLASTPGSCSSPSDFASRTAAGVLPTPQQAPINANCHK